MTNLFEQLGGRTALVTGATMGIGRAVAVRLASLGANVIVSASGRDPDKLEETRQLVENQGVRCATLAADLFDGDARQRLMEQAQILFGPVDILINNAGSIAAYAPPSKIDLSARLRTFEINFQAPVDLMQAALPSMRKRGWGRIVNITSGSANQNPPPYLPPMKMNYAIVAYGAAKAALNRATQGFAAELAGSGVHVNAVTPSKICASESAMDLARMVAQVHPDWIEGVEMMSEATAILVASSFTGVVANSRDVLAMVEAPLRSADGRQIIGDASSYPAMA